MATSKQPSTTCLVDLEPREKLERFCFIGNFKPTLYKRRTSILVGEFYDKLDDFVQQIPPKVFASIIKKCASYDGIRKDEVFLSIYVFMFHVNIPPCDKKIIRELFPEIATTGKDILLYVNIVKQCSVFKKKKMYSKITKKMLENWYKSQSSNTLTELFCAKKTYYGFCHNDVFRIFHISDEVIDNPVVAQLLFKSKVEIEESKKTKKIISIRKIFNENTEDEELLPLLEQHTISFDNIPKSMFKRVEVWKTILDKSQAPEILRFVSTLILEKFFKNSNSRELLQPTFDKCVEKIKEMFAENESRAVDQKVNIHPSTIYFVLKTLLVLMATEENTLSKKKRKGKGKKVAIEKKEETKKEVKFAAENEEITQIMDLACKNYKGDGLRIISTFQLSYKSHSDFIRTSDYKIMEYLSSLSLLYPYTYCVKNNACFMFGKKDTLTPIQMKDSFEEEKEKIRKMYQKWTDKGESKCHLPIKEAFTSKKGYDLFVTVVRYTSLCTKVLPLTALFQKYRDHKNPQAKMVIINMRLKSPGLKFQESKKEGILEICHFDADTPNIIRAFALNYFN